MTEDTVEDRSGGDSGDEANGALMTPGASGQVAGEDAREHPGPAPAIAAVKQAILDSRQPRSPHAKLG